MDLLADLPSHHPDRNRPLVGCRYRWRGSKGTFWHTVNPTMKIAQNTYNDLGAAWTDHDDWCWDPQPSSG